MNQLYKNSIWNKTKLAFGGIFAALIISGCNAIPPVNLKSPDIAFSDVSIGDIGLSKVKFVVTVNAQNTNDVDIPLSDMKFNLALMDSQFATGVGTETNTVIPKKGSKAIPIEFTVGTSQLIDMVRKLNIKDLGNFTYKLNGSAKWGSGPFSVPFERKGDLQALKKLSDMLGVLVK